MRAEGHDYCSDKSDTFRLLFDPIGYDTDLSLHEAGFEIDFALIDHALLKVEAFQLLRCHLFRSQSVSPGSEICPANAKARLANAKARLDFICISGYTPYVEFSSWTHQNVVCFSTFWSFFC